MKKIILSVLVVSFASILSAQQKNEQYYVKAAPFKMTVPVQPKFAAKPFFITDFGAIGNGQVLNTAAFAKAIAACVKVGGGRVIVPAGLWLTGPIQMQSNVNLVVERGALVQFTPDRTQYPLIQMGGSSSFVVASPVYGYNLRNVAITGEGILDGAGESWRPVKKGKLTESQWKALTSSGVVSKDGSVWWPSKEALEGENFLKTLKNRKGATAEDYQPARDFLRPHMVYLTHCENVLVEGVTIRNSPKFAFYPNNCSNLTLRSVNVFNEWWAQNGDAIDISACKNVLVYKCNVSAGDDGLCMKSSGATNPATAKLENVVVAGCTVYHGHGGFVIGSNTDGGMNNIFVADCNFIGTDIGIRVKSNAGRGGLVHNVSLRNIYMTDIVNEAISFDTYYEDVPAGKEKGEVRTVVKDKLPVFTDFSISDVYCRGAKTAIAITGLPQMPVQKIHFTNVVLAAENGYEVKDAKDIRFTNAKWITPNGNAEDLAALAKQAKSELSFLRSLSFKPHSSIDLAEFGRQYAANRNLWEKAFAYLKNTDLRSLPAGKYKIAGDSVTASVTEGPEKVFDSTKWESHQKFIDFQYIISGKEKMGVAKASNAKVVKSYDAAKDVANYETDGQFFVADPSQFFIFFPQDAHRPNIKVEDGNVKKIVLKIAVAK